MLEYKRPDMTERQTLSDSEKEEVRKIFTQAEAVYKAKYDEMEANETAEEKQLKLDIDIKVRNAIIWAYSLPSDAKIWFYRSPFPRDKNLRKYDYMIYDYDKRSSDYGSGAVHYNLTLKKTFIYRDPQIQEWYIDRSY